MLKKIIRRTLSDWFLLGMISSVILASLFPRFGATGGTMHADIASNAGIFMIFLFHGMDISPQAMKNGLARWKLHLTVQTTTFVIFPLLFFAFKYAFSGIVPEDLMWGFLYLCALPSTISSSVAMTAIAHGNVPGAIFNATLSNLIGIFLTPMIIGLVLSTEGASLPLGQAILNISILLFLPFVLGQALRPWFKGFISRHKKGVNTFDKLVILMLVYSAFCDSVKSGLWTNYGVSLIFITIGGAAVILGFILVFNTFSARLLGFDKEDEITAVMCGSKKTLAAGVPMAKLLFPGNPILGLIVLPIMFYHQLQLFACSILAERYARRLKDQPAENCPEPKPASAAQAVPAAEEVRA
jgi:sodium/bile acid cotransporter 7